MSRLETPRADAPKPISGSEAATDSLVDQVMRLGAISARLEDVRNRMIGARPKPEKAKSPVNEVVPNTLADRLRSLNNGFAEVCSGIEDTLAEIEGFV